MAHAYIIPIAKSLYFKLPLTYRERIKMERGHVIYIPMNTNNSCYNVDNTLPKHAC